MSGSIMPDDRTNTDRMVSCREIAADIILAGVNLLMDDAGVDETARRLSSLAYDLKERVAPDDEEDRPAPAICDMARARTLAGRLNGPPAAKPAVMKFGKYKGRLLSDVARDDAQYLRWAIDKAGRPEEENTAMGKALMDTGKYGV